LFKGFSSPLPYGPKPFAQCQGERIEKLKIGAVNNTPKHWPKRMHPQAHINHTFPHQILGANAWGCILPNLQQKEKKRKNQFEYHPLCCIVN